MKIAIKIIIILIAGGLWGYLMNVLIEPPISYIFSFLGGFIIGIFGVCLLLKKIT